MSREISENKFIKFKRYLKNSLYLSDEERKQFDKIPPEFFEKIFSNNFNGNLELARKIFFNEYNSIYQDDLLREIQKINNYNESLNTLLDYIDNDKKILFVTDIDNDGSLSQAALLEFKRLMPEKVKNIDIVFSQNINNNNERGITVDLIEKWAEENNIDKKDDFLILTADNGINSRSEQMKIMHSFEKCKLIITDHHLPEKELVVQENKRTLIFNPKYKPTDFFLEDKNISGAHTLAVLLRGLYLNYEPENQSKLKYLDRICQVSNLLDYVQTDIRFKPLENYLIDEFNSLGPLLNVNSSLSKLITDDFDSEFVEKANSTIPNFESDIFIDAIMEIKEQNLLSSKLIQLQIDYTKLLENNKRLIKEGLEEDIIEKNEDDFHKDFMDILFDKDRGFEHFNKNYIEQLRPFIYHNTVRARNDLYEIALNDAMKNVYTVLKKAEKKLIEQLRKGDVMDFVQRDNVTLLYPKHPEITDVFNRRFLTKVYNEENKGFFAIINEVKGEEFKGSFRGLYNASDFVKQQNKLKNIEIEFRGHERAAGIYLRSEDGMTIDKLEKFADFCQETIEGLQRNVKIENKYVQIDFSNFELIEKINNKIKAHVNNMESIKPLIKLTRSQYFTDKETLKNISVGQMLKKNKYGYTVIKLNFQDDAIIMSTETLRQLEKSNFKDYLQLSYLSDGAFISTGIVPSSELKARNLVKLESSTKKEQLELQNYYKEEFFDKNRFTKDLSRDSLKNMEIFRRNSFGEQEFDRTEELLLKIIDYYALDHFIVCDTEADGLGKAPKLINLGNLEISVKEDSGTEISMHEFNEIMSSDIKKSLFKKKLKNIKYIPEKNKVIYNREIKAELLSALITDNDVKIVQTLESLTMLNQTMLNKYGARTADFDKFLTEKYKGKKVLIQAHNSNYDIGAVMANLPQFKKEVVDKNLICDSAVIAKQERLAYSDIQVANFGKSFNAVAEHAYFFSNPLADFSLDKYLESEDDFIFPDMRNEYFLKRRGNDYTLIDIRKNQEITLSSNTEELIKNLKNVNLPLNRIKYSVVSLLKYDNIRSMLLHDIKDKIEKIETPEYIIEHGRKASELFQEYTNNYHFDCLPLTNLRHFRTALKLDGRHDDYDLLDMVVEETRKTPRSKPQLVLLADRFLKGAEEYLEKNREAYLKYVTPWQYQKVLEVYDPIKDTISRDQLKSISYKTGIPDWLVTEILSDIYSYKKKLGIKGDFFVKELHNNVNENGDAPVEGMEVMKRLLDRHYNPYSKTTDDAFNVYIDVVEKTTYRYAMRDNFENKLQILSLNGFSLRQLRSYSNRRDSEGNLHVSENVKLANNMKKAYFQFSEKIISNGTHVKAEKMPDNPSNELVDLTTNKIKLVLLREILKNNHSMFKKKDVKALTKSMSVEDKIEFINQKIEANKNSDDREFGVINKLNEICEDIISDISNHFGKITFTREKADFKDLGDQIWAYIQGYGDVKKSLDYMSEDQKEKVINLIDVFMDVAKRLKVDTSEEKADKLKHLVREFEPREFDGIEDSILGIRKMKPLKLAQSEHSHDLHRLALRDEIGESDNLGFVNDFIKNAHTPIITKKLPKNENKVFNKNKNKIKKN